MEISITELQTALNRVFDHIVTIRGVSSVNIDKSFYWNIPFVERFDVGQDPSNLDIGSLNDEWEFAQNLLTKESPPIAYQLCQLAPILDYIGHILSEKLAPDGG